MTDVSKNIEEAFRWTTLLNRLKKSSILVERIQTHKDAMINFKFEKLLVEFMASLTEEQQKTLEIESMVFANICPSDMDEKEFKILQHELLMEESSALTQYDYALTFKDKDNENQKIKWLTKAAEKQNLDAQKGLAWLYDHKEDYKQAVFWYTAAAKQGCAASKHNLAVCYRRGLGAEKDEKKAFQLYAEIADHDANGQNNLGTCYEYGYGAEKNNKKAFELYTRSINGGCIAAYANLAALYALGKVVTQDFKKAKELYQLGSNKGQKECKIGLGWCYLNGHGVEKNPILAYDLFLQASNSDQELANSLMKKYKQL